MATARFLADEIERVTNHDVIASSAEPLRRLLL